MKEILMSQTQWHLLLTHLPLVGIVIGTLVLLASYTVKNNTMVKRTALCIFTFGALMAIPVYLTGEGAEEGAEHLPGVTEAAIESHEELGKNFLIIALVLGSLAIGTLLSDWFGHKSARMLYGIVLAAGIGTSFFAKQVGASGGEVRHTEIREGAAQEMSVTPPEDQNEMDEEKNE